jgi:hypothetical protein
MKHTDIKVLQREDEEKVEMTVTDTFSSGSRGSWGHRWVTPTKGDPGKGQNSGLQNTWRW